MRFMSTSTVAVAVAFLTALSGCCTEPAVADPTPARSARPASRPVSLAVAHPEAVSDATRAHDVYPSMAVRPGDTPLPVPPDDGFDWQTQGPLELLDFLQRGLGQQTPGWPPCFTVDGTHRDWLRASDIPALLERFDDETPCLAVVKTISSILPRGSSTVGNEAAQMVSSYRAQVTGTGYGGYPVALNSTRFPVDRDELRAWWKQHSGAR